MKFVGGLAGGLEIPPFRPPPVEGLARTRLGVSGNGPLSPFPRWMAPGRREIPTLSRCFFSKPPLSPRKTRHLSPSRRERETQPLAHFQRAARPIIYKRSRGLAALACMSIHTCECYKSAEK